MLDNLKSWKQTYFEHRSCLLVQRQVDVQVVDADVGRRLLATQHFVQTEPSEWLVNQVSKSRVNQKDLQRQDANMQVNSTCSGIHQGVEVADFDY